MRSLIILLSVALAASCATAPAPLPPMPTLTFGCTVPIPALPQCQFPIARPYFDEGASAAEVTDAYEFLKDGIQKAETCIGAVYDTVDQFRLACEEQD